MSLLTLWFFFVALPGVSTVLGAVAFVMVAAAVVMAIIHDDIFGNTEEDRRRSKAFFIRWLLCTVIALVGANILPSSTQVATIASLYVATNAEGVEKLPDNVVQYVNKYLEDGAKGDE